MEARDWRWRILGIAVRHPFFNQHVGLGQNGSISAAVCGALAECKGAGSGYVPGPLVFYGLRGCHRVGEPGNKTHG